MDKRQFDVLIRKNLEEKGYGPFGYQMGAKYYDV